MPSLSSQEEKYFDKHFPRHVGHEKQPMPITGLVAPVLCVPCNVVLKATLVSILVMDAEESGWRWLPEFPPEEKSRKDEKYPHKCPKCGGPAYVGFSSVDCKNKCR